MPDTTDIEPRSEPGAKPEPDPAIQQAADDAARRKARIRRFAIALAIGIAGAIIGGIEIHDRLTNIHEVDARISGDLITVASRVSGWVTALKIQEGDAIKQGDVLVTIDSRQSALQVQELEAQVAGLRAQKERLVAERDLVDKETASKLKSEHAQLEAAQVRVSSLQPQLELARRERERSKSLFEKRVASRRQLDQAETELQKIERAHRIAMAELRTAEAKVSESEAERERLRVIDNELAVFGHREAEMQAKLAAQRLDLNDRTIKSSINGVVDKTFVQVGEYVSPGQRLALIHDPNVVWIDANIKETDIRKLKVGDEVQVSVDAYPDRTFKGRIAVIGNATTAEFALLPSPNPSGNFTKITQRLPVRISIDQEQKLLRPGMMVEIKIDVEQ